MSNPVIHAFFVGKALAEIIYEKVEDSLTVALSELGKFDAEQRENLRQFSEEVIARAEREADQSTQGVSTPTTTSPRPQSSSDLQETIDELRAEIARVRAELTTYRNQSA